MKIVIIGCTHAGIAAAKAAKKSAPDAEVIIYERDDNVSFLSCGIALYLNQEVNQLSDMFYETPAHLHDLGIDIHIKHDVIKVDASRKSLTVQDLTSTTLKTRTYDKLIVTTGSYVKVPPLCGIDNTRVLMCKDARHAEAIQKAAATSPKITIVGGGFVGVELAEAYANTDHDVTLLQRGNQLLNNFIDQNLSEKVVSALTDHGVTVATNQYVTAFSRGTTADEVVIETKTDRFTTNLVIVCTGFLANTSLLRGQVAMDSNGALLTNPYMQTSDPSIYSAGDACVVKFNPTQQVAYIPLATNAVRQGTLAGRNAVGHPQRYLGSQATTALRLFDNTLATTGLTVGRAQLEHIDVDHVTYQGPYRPTFMAQHAEVLINLVYQRKTREVLGMQLLSHHDISESANAISIAIQHHTTIDELAEMDMLFNPHYDQPYHYLNLVSQLAVDQADKA
ncbi:FAD-dependent oxidoreductase [uncultured Secundilactobacillus sp.]|uniref:FAD-dependent oxidoreductase n=1 Tax=uncultured Secundilactobacillus sp. TaxID=2813935 RepID=UPI002584B6A6|nr:FAD-dependent oxidoreductase [uncultured Secundilactobacillus sp.]